MKTIIRMIIKFWSKTFEITSKEIWKRLTNINKTSNYWIEFFEKRASNYNLKESYKVNGFIDNKLLKQLEIALEK